MVRREAGTTGVRIGPHVLGDGRPPLVIAELSGNHGGDLGRARALVEAAAEAGAHVVKTQTYTADTITLRCDRPEFRVGGGLIWSGRLLADLYDEAHTPWAWNEPLRDLAHALGLGFCSSAFDPTAVAHLEALDVDAHKLASFELVDIGLIETMAATGRTLIMSTGMATAAEIDEAVDAARRAGADPEQLVLLRCSSAYPATPADMDLASIPAMRERWSCPVGLSDHSPGHLAAVVAVALGATVIEKHLTLRRADGGPDASFSLEPAEFAELVRAVRDAHAALGRVRFGPDPQEAASVGLRRSLYFVRSLAAGDVVGADDVRSVRPANGLHPRHHRDVVGRRLSAAVDEGTPVTWESFAS